MPKSLLQRPPLNTTLGHKIARANAFRYLDAFIQDGYRRLRTSNHRLLDLKAQLQTSLPNYLLDDLVNTINIRKSGYRLNIKRRLQDKYDHLLSNQTRSSTSPRLNWVVNLSSHTISPNEHDLLEKGLNFSLPNTKRNIPKFVATLENSIYQLNNVSEEEKSIIRYQVCGAIRSSDDSNCQLNKDEQAALKSLKNNEDIVIAPADKGCAVVIMDKIEYIEKINEHLQDTETYEEKNVDTTPSLRVKINSFLKKLSDKTILSRQQYLHLFANSATVPLFYALVKIHKVGNPIRPIVSFINSPSYNIAKFLSNLLTPSTNKSPHKLKNSLDAKNKLKNFIVPQNFQLVSFDVKALFTSIPQNFAIDCVKTFLNNNTDIFDRTKLCVTEILELITICLDATLFVYNNKYYKQIKGTPMGSPVSVVIAEIVMQKLEEIIMLKVGNLVEFWYRYVDDIITCVKEDQVEYVLREINSIKSDLQFTLEREADNIINFLDLKIIKSVIGTLSFSVFRKNTHTDKYLNFSSYHPIEHKNSVVRSLLHRANTLCDNEYITNENIHVINALECNGYNKNTIDNISRQINQSSNNHQITDFKYISAPYIRGTSERVARILRKYDIKLAHKPTRTLKHELTHLKDKQPAFNKAGVVYKLDCNECDAVYVGETGRQVKDRMREHQNDIVKAKQVSKVYNHVNETGHSFNFDNVTVLDNCQSVKVRLQLECIHTELQSNSINRSLNMNSIYHSVINRNGDR